MTTFRTEYSRGTNSFVIFYYLDCIKFKFPDFSLIFPNIHFFTDLQQNSLTFPWLLPSLEFPWLFPDRWTPWSNANNFDKSYVWHLNSTSDKADVLPWFREDWTEMQASTKSPDPRKHRTRRYSGLESQWRLTTDGVRQVQAGGEADSLASGVSYTICSGSCLISLSRPPFFRGPLWILRSRYFTAEFHLSAFWTDLTIVCFGSIIAHQCISSLFSW